MREAISIVMLMVVELFVIIAVSKIIIELV